ncbi:MAG TPA: R3H domain-containing nucleic acid-binding protein [Pyrinomonadaceae bacterium]|jgi:spoIIIJ-associated protein
MSEVFNQAQDFLNDVFESAGFNLRAKATASEDATTVLDIDGSDAALLRSEGGELLDALEHFVNQIYARQLPQGERLICDVHSFRAMREAELRAMARHAAERVRQSGVPFIFGSMTANERRVIHLTLAEDEQLHTESIGEGNARRLKVSLKSSLKK